MSNWLTLSQVGGEVDSAPAPSPTAAQHAPATWEAIAEVAQEVENQHQEQEEQTQQEQQQLDLHQGQLAVAVALDGPIHPEFEQKMPGSGGSADSTYVMRYVLSSYYCNLYPC